MSEDIKEIIRKAREKKELQNSQALMEKEQKQKAEQKAELPELPSVPAPLPIPQPVVSQQSVPTIEQVYQANDGVFRRDLIVLMVEQNKIMEGILEALAFLVQK